MKHEGVDVGEIASENVRDKEGEGVSGCECDVKVHGRKGVKTRHGTCVSGRESASRGRARESEGEREKACVSVRERGRARVSEN
eukprot:6192746-Pleurochrysis_carterae.AAC.1